jgi:hypothetical protein
MITDKEELRPGSTNQSTMGVNNQCRAVEQEEELNANA